MTDYHRALGYILIGFGLLFATISWALMRARKDVHRVLLALADYGPSSMVELRRRSGYKFLSYAAIEHCVESNLVSVRYRTNSARTAAIRGELKTREFRLNTAGWQEATRLRAAGSLEDS